MAIQYRSTTAEIDLHAFRSNFLEIKKRLSQGISPMAIVKANAYGHGAVRCARTLEELGVRQFGVATVEEGVELRDAGIRAEIVVLDGLLTDSLQVFLDYRLKPVLHQLEDVSRWGSFLHEKTKEETAYIKLDTGMGRLGFLPSQTDALVELLKKYSEILVQGIFTHLAQADEEESAPTERQFVLFERMHQIFEAKILEARMGYQPKGNKTIYTIANSAAIIDDRLSGYSLVRPGIILYGAYPHIRHRDKISLKPVMKLKTVLCGIKQFPSGSALGYGATFVTQRESRIGILPIGYADGYPRLVSNKGSVLVRGKRAPVVGRISMDLTSVDVTDIPECASGDEVVLIGSQGEDWLRAEEVAGWADTISYEIFCGISSRVPRIYRGI